MYKDSELNKILSEIDSYKLRAEAISNYIKNSERDMPSLKSLQNYLVNNLSTLKNSDTIVSSLEYRKIKKNLIDVDNKLKDLQIDIKNQKNNLKIIQTILDNANEKYKKILENRENNIVIGKFGKNE